MSRILVVDDEPDLRFVLRRLLEGAGHEVVEAGNGADALQRIGESAPDLVVTDMMMPVMTGGELIRRLRADVATKGIPILVVTAYSGHEATTDVTVVDKPYLLAPLLATVRELLGRKAGGS